MRRIGAFGAVTALLMTASAAAGASHAYQDYLLRCSGCHGADRSGVPSRGVPSLRQADLALFLRTPAGRAFLAQVPGVSESPLNDDEVADVLNWLLAGTPSLRRYTPSEIREDRRHRLVDVEKARSRVVAHMREYPSETEPLHPHSDSRKSR